MLENEWMRVSDAALEIGRSYRSTLDLLFRGELRGRRVGRWFEIDPASVKAFQRARPAGPRREPAHV